MPFDSQPSLALFLSHRLTPTTSVPMHFAASLETLNIPVRTKRHVSGIVSFRPTTFGQSDGGVEWFAPLVCEEFYQQWAAKKLDGIMFVTMCMLAAEAYNAEWRASIERKL